MAYHHGDLPAALLAAVAEIVRDRGIAAVTLREAARRTGVSHAAPAHHFGDKAGMLTAFATQGCAMLHEQELAAREHPPDGHTGLFSIGVAYVRFAIEHPEHFAVMFRSEYLHTDDPVYQAARDGAFSVLLESVREIRSDVPADDPAIMRAAAGAWSIVHGMATLWLGGNLDHAITRKPPQEAAAEIMVNWGETMFRSAAGRIDQS